MKIRPVILAGGEGKRLAPLSTPERPKPFIPLPDGQSLLEKTLRRLDHPDMLPPVLMGRHADRYALLNHARAARIMPATILLEQKGLDTAFAVAVATHFQRQRDPEPVMAILPADHLIEDIEAWQQAVLDAAMLATQTQQLVLMGMEYETFSSELGYLCREGNKVTRFIEKPESEDKLGANGQWLSNSGQFFGTSKAFSEILAKNCPKIWSISAKSIHDMQKQWEYEAILPPESPISPLSFDREVLEKAQHLHLVAAQCGWRDLGTLEAWKIQTKESIEEQMRMPKRVDRPWGYYELLDATAERAIKRLYVFPGCRLSRQRHFHRSEHWTVESGTAYIEKGETKTTLGPYEQIKIPPATWHRLVNPTENMLIIKEIQYGISDEMDIEREADDYGRI